MVKPKFLDILLYVLAIGFCAFLMFYPQNKGEASFVTIKTEQNTYRYSLSNDRDLEIEGDEGLTKIRIEDKRVWVTESSCKNKDCIRNGKIAQSGQSIVCLPNRVVIQIEGESEIDAISI